MSGARPRHGAGRPVDDQARGGRRERTGEPGGEPVQQLEGLGRLAALQQRRRQGAAQLTHDRRGGRPLADDVADGDGHAVVHEVDDVVPVAAGLGALGAGQVVGGQRQAARGPGSSGRQQAALQRLGDALLGPVQPGPVERLRALLGDGEQHRPLVGAEALDVGKPMR